MPPPTNKTAANVPIHLAIVIIIVAKSPCFDKGNVIIKKVSRMINIQMLF